MSALDLVAVGDVMLDVVAAAAEPGARVHAPVSVRAGGSAVNAAREAARTGARAAAVGRVGDDAAGRAIAAELRRTGVVPLLAVDAARPTGTVVVAGDAVVADRGANAAFAPEDVPRGIEARVLLVSGYLLFAGGSAAGAEAALAAVRAELTAVDLAAASLARDPGAAVDVVLGDAPSVTAVTGAPPEAGVRALADGRRAACATLGAAGAVAAAGGELARAAPPRTLGGDAVGAGDVFAARFLLALAGGAPLAAALGAACDAASIRRTRRR